METAASGSNGCLFTGRSETRHQERGLRPAL